MTIVKVTVLACAMLGWCVSLNAQLITFSREQMTRSTAENPYDRFEDGRPKVPDALLERLRECSLEEVWTVLQKHEYTRQYDGRWQVLHPDRKLVGRAVTAQYLPVRPDLFNFIEGQNQGLQLPHTPAEGALGHGTGYRRMVDVLRTGDVLVVDLFGSVDSGGPIGDNMATAIYAATHAGLVIDGAVRDLDGILEIPMGAYFRAPNPAAVNNVMLSGINIPIRIGTSTVMPGDIVLGDREGVYFIPPQFVQEIVTAAEVTHIHDEWTKMKLLTGKYKASDLYPTPWDPQLKKEYEGYLKQKLGK
ncbi:MAG: dimethylmenaquinone methyltransferase [Terriglobia bacterium]|jgi:regulator of RNase E activity RraA